MAGYTRNDTLNNIADGNIINAADLDGEFDALVAAFHASTGHVHDGTAANGAPITKTGPAQEFIASSSAFTPKTDDTYDLGSATFQFKDLYIDGTAYVDAIDFNGTAITATGTELNYVSGVTSAIQTQLNNKQGLDAELTAIAGLTSAADKVPYFTGSGTAAVADFTSFGRSLVDDADASAARTTLGLVIGTNVQAYDAELAALAGLTSAADKVPYFTGSGTASVADFTSFGRSLVDDADASAARSTLGLGTIATQASSNVSITGGSITGITDLAIADGGTGASTANAALNNLLPSQGSNAGKYLVTDGTNTSWDQINISTSDITGTLPIANGGTGSTTASGARTALGLEIGTNVQAYDPQLADVAGLTPTDNGVIIGNGTNFVIETGSTLRTSLGLAIGTDVQAYDPELAAIAGLTSAADKLPYFTGSGTASLADFTSFGRSLVDDADSSAARTTLGLVIGTNVQAYDAELAALAGLTSAADKLPYFTGSGTASLADFTSFGRSLVDDADASAARTTLGVAIGTNVQAYDSNLTSFVNTFTLPTSDGSNGQVLQTNGSGTLSFATFNADPAGTAVALAIALG
jgi:hypothetical protein